MLSVHMQSDLTVREIMSREFVGVSEADDIADVAHVLREEEVSTAAVVRGSEPVGIISALDLLPLVPEGVSDATAEEFMRNPEAELSPDAPLVEALDWMSTQGTGRLLVVEGEELVGVVTAADLLTATASLLENGTNPRESVEAVESTSAGAVADRTVSPDPGTEYSSQSVCESCGTLTQQLQNFNGQMLCADCRDV